LELAAAELQRATADTRWWHGRFAKCSEVVREWHG